MKQSRSMPAILLVLLLVTGGFAHSAPRINPDPFFSSVGGAAEPLDVETLIDAAVRASGASVNGAAAAAARINQLISKMKGEIKPEWGERETAEYVLTFLHDNMFGLYDEFQTRVDRVVTDGSFNCVSSAVLYMIFSRSVGIPVAGIGTADHAFCAAVLPEGRVDVETTSVYGFDPGKKKDFHDAFGNITGYSYVPPSQAGGRADLGERELIGLVLQNRISLLESGKDYAEAVELAVDRYAMAPGETTRDHLVRGVLNYAALLNERREYEEAIEFLTLFVDSYGWSESLESIFGVLYYNQVVVLIQNEAFSEARDTMAEAEAPGWIGPAVLKDLRSQIAERILAKELPVLTPAEGLILLSSLRDEGLLSAERYLDFAVMLVSKEAEEVAGSGDYLIAAGIIEDAVAKLGPDRRLEAAKDAYRYNYVVEIHNEFAALFNKAEYEAASELLNSAIEKVPESQILLDDLDTLKDFLSQTN